VIPSTASKRVRRKFFICATTFLTLQSWHSIRQNPLDGRFRCTDQYCLCCLARSGLLIPIHSSRDLVKSSTFEYSRSSLTIPAQSTKHHAQLRNAYALHYRTRRQNATLLHGPDDDERALTTRLLSPLESRHKSMSRWSPTSRASCLSHNFFTTYSKLSVWTKPRPLYRRIQVFDAGPTTTCGFRRHTSTSVRLAATKSDHGCICGCPPLRLPFRGCMGSCV
jgi:hypothetical protein